MKVLRRGHLICTIAKVFFIIHVVRARVLCVVSLTIVITVMNVR